MAFRTPRRRGCAGPSSRRMVYNAQRGGSQHGRNNTTDQAPPYTRSAPDVTRHHARWTGRVHWRSVVEMSSDHLPIVVDIQTTGRPARRRAMTCPSCEKADFGIDVLDEEIRNLPDWDNRTTIKAATKQLSGQRQRPLNRQFPRVAESVRNHGGPRRSGTQ